MPAAAMPAPVVSQRPGWLNDILEVAGREVKQVAQQVIAQAAASLKQTVQSRVPHLIERAVPGRSTATAGSACTTGNGASQFAGGI
jgi:hypothetical protein